MIQTDIKPRPGNVSDLRRDNDRSKSDPKWPFIANNVLTVSPYDIGNSDPATFGSLQDAYNSVKGAIKTDAGVLKLTNGNYHIRGSVATFLPKGVSASVISLFIDSTEEPDSTGTLTLWDNDGNTETVDYTAVIQIGDTNVFGFSVGSFSPSYNHYIGGLVYTDTESEITIDSSDDRISVIAEPVVCGVAIS